MRLDLTRGPRARPAIVGMAVLVYFFLFPGDLAVLLAPLERTLSLTNAVSPWLYGLLAVALIAKVIVKVWGSRPSIVERGSS